jgi:hypothetical protein
VFTLRQIGPDPKIRIAPETLLLAAREALTPDPYAPPVRHPDPNLGGYRSYPWRWSSPIEPGRTGTPPHDPAYSQDSAYP